MQTPHDSVAGRWLRTPGVGLGAVAASGMEEHALGRHDELIQQAQALGRAIAGHQTAREFREAQLAVRDSAESQALLSSYTRQAEHIRALEADRKPIEVADKRKLAEAEERMASDKALKRMARAQADYLDLMNTIYSAIQEALIPEPPKST